MFQNAGGKKKGEVQSKELKR